MSSCHNMDRDIQYQTSTYLTGATKGAIHVFQLGTFPGSLFSVEMMQRTANENAACLRRICKRSDQPKIERLVNNDARLMLRRKLNGATTR